MHLFSLVVLCYFSLNDKTNNNNYTFLQGSTRLDGTVTHNIEMNVQIENYALIACYCQMATILNLPFNEIEI